MEIKNTKYSFGGREKRVYSAFCPQLELIVRGTAHQQVEEKMKQLIIERVSKAKMAQPAKIKKPVAQASSAMLPDILPAKFGVVALSLPFKFHSGGAEGLTYSIPDELAERAKSVLVCSSHSASARKQEFLLAYRVKRLQSRLKYGLLPMF